MTRPPDTPPNTSNAYTGGPDLGIGQAAGDGRVAPVPQLSGQPAAGLLGKQLDQRAGIEVNDGQSA